MALKNKTKGSEEDFPGHGDVRAAEVVTEFTEHSAGQLTQSQKTAQRDQDQQLVLVT